MSRTMFFLMSAMLVVSSARGATADGPGQFTYQGRILKSNGHDPVEDASVVFKVQIRSNDGVCLLFEETHLRDMTDSNGVFSLTIGAGSNSGATALTLPQVFNNASPLTGASGCAYTPAAGDGRKFRLAYDNGTEVVSMPMDQNVLSVPYAMNARTLQGLSKDSFFMTSGASTQAKLDDVLSRWSDIMTMAGGTVKVADTPSAGDSAVNKNYCDSKLGGANLDTTGLANGQTLIWNSGTGKWVAGTAALPTVSALTSGTIGGSTIINTTGTISAPSVSATTVSSQALRVYEATNTHRVTLVAPAGLASDVSLVLPASQGALGQSLTTDGSGNLSWASPSIKLNELRSSVAGALFPVAACTAAQTLQYQSGTDTFVCTDVAIPKSKVTGLASATTSAEGLVQLAADGGSTAGTAVQATDLRLTNARAPTGAAGGDLAGSTFPNPTVSKLRGIALSSTAPINGQFFKYDGTEWKPFSLSIADVKSSFGGAMFPGAACTAAQGLQYQSGTDSFICVDIAIPKSKVSGLGTAASLDVGSSANQIVQLDSSGRLPASDGSQLTNLPAAPFQNLQVLASGSGNWTVPAGVTKIKVEIWGGGGGGGGGKVADIGGSGGSAGAYGLSVLTVTPGANIAYSVGTGGNGGAANNGGAGRIVIWY